MNPIDKLIKALSKFPGVGSKSAARIAYHIMRDKTENVSDLVNAIANVKKKIKLCSECFNLTEDDPCYICSNPRRNNKSVCIVEDPQDASAIESTGTFKGVYHILHGAISPLDGVGPENIKVKELVQRLEKNAIKELIVATNPTIEGEATAHYITKIARPYKIRLSRIAFGIPFGGDIEYTDKSTLSRALESRLEIKE